MIGTVACRASSATVAVVLQKFSGSEATSSAPLYGQLMAAALISGIPVVALYLVFQRYLISGLSAGSLSGT